MASFSHYSLTSWDSSKSVENLIKLKSGRALMCFILYLTDVSSVANFLHHPQTFKSTKLRFSKALRDSFEFGCKFSLCLTDNLTVTNFLHHLVQVLSCEFWEFSKNTFFHRTPPVAASVALRYSHMLLCLIINRGVIISHI